MIQNRRIDNPHHVRALVRLASDGFTANTGVAEGAAAEESTDSLGSVVALDSAGGSSNDAVPVYVGMAGVAALSLRARPRSTAPKDLPKQCLL